MEMRSMCAYDAYNLLSNSAEMDGNLPSDLRGGRLKIEAFVGVK
jgi:hypothetical protein